MPVNFDLLILIGVIVMVNVSAIGLILAFYTKRAENKVARILLPQVEKIHEHVEALVEMISQANTSVEAQSKLNHELRELNMTIRQEIINLKAKYE